MRFDILTIFPDFFRGPLDYGVVARAHEAGVVDVRIHNLRDFAHDQHRTTDDRPFGGGEGMVMKPEPVYECLASIVGKAECSQRASESTFQRTRVCLLSAQGKLFQQPEARTLSQLERLVLICGRYEGVDERVAQHLADAELSVGDFVLSGGEIAAALVLDCVARLIPGVLGDEQSVVNESFAEVAEGASSTRPAGILDCPHFTRPVTFHGWTVPEVLRGGNHAEINRWRLKQALLKTQRNRPELLEPALQDARYRELLNEALAEAQT
jgi:tRNA (guanine37-N1)-methyltransferase